ncbi:carbohydrate ABC transporter permease [Paenibacillus agricola]|uniref:Carbohydrate ABC transporter permease n=1 Tax=Paenibacillus agricola TaxID=2716264 RepID=A0ABX0JAU6_9BACL|nr:carbohydrate ABC transporter permease [Paenibacillus agricola]NHN32344.1 carbohydrate ABC transporter permease [Paenibacillus agricola]
MQVAKKVAARPKLRGGIKPTFGSLLFDCAIYVILIAMVLVFLYPLYYMTVVSVSNGLYVIRGEVKWFPIGFNLDAYKMILSDASIIRAYGNTLLYTTVGTFINVCATALCAYPLSRNKLYGRKLFTLFIIITMLFHGGMIPSYLVVNSLQLTNSIWAIVIPPAINVWYMIIMRTFFQNIPNEIHESAYMDGANDLTIFLRIVLPLSLPVIATMTMFYAVWHWNSFFPAMIYLFDNELYPVQIIMRSMLIDGSIGSNDVSRDLTTIQTNMKYAVIIITILPIIAVYPFIQKYFVQGAMVGSLKG